MGDDDFLINFSPHFFIPSSLSVCNAVFPPFVLWSCVVVFFAVSCCFHICWTLISWVDKCFFCFSRLLVLFTPSTPTFLYSIIFSFSRSLSSHAIQNASIPYPLPFITFHSIFSLSIIYVNFSVAFLSLCLLWISHKLNDKSSTFYILFEGLKLS